MRTRWVGRDVVRRLPRLMLGLVMFGAAIALMVHSELGLPPWEIFHQGISRMTGIPIGTVSVIVGAAVLLAWIPLGESPGIGTALNVVTVGTSTNVALVVMPTSTDAAVRVAFEATGIILYAVATGIYLSADLGPGPRDGLMTAMHHRYGWRIGWARTAIEIVVLLVGVVMGGTLGIGTVVFALTMGPLIEMSLRIFDREGRVLRRRAAEDAELVPLDGAT
jgi:uncharacterized membrane protein YczE